MRHARLARQADTRCTNKPYSGSRPPENGTTLSKLTPKEAAPEHGVRFPQKRKTTRSQSAAVLGKRLFRKDPADKQPDGQRIGKANQKHRTIHDFPDSSDVNRSKPVYTSKKPPMTAIAGDGAASTKTQNGQMRFPR